MLTNQPATVSVHSHIDPFDANIKQAKDLMVKRDDKAKAELEVAKRTTRDLRDMIAKLGSQCEVTTSRLRNLQQQVRQSSISS